jgi:hypothetical protein
MVYARQLDGSTILHTRPIAAVPRGLASLFRAWECQRNRSTLPLLMTTLPSSPLFCSALHGRHCSAHRGQPLLNRLRAMQLGQRKRLDTVHLLHRVLVWLTANRNQATEVSVSPPTSLRSSLSTTTVRTPPALPPLKEGPPNSVV